MTEEKLDPRIQRFHTNADKLGLTIGEYALLLLGEERIDAIENARREEAEQGQ